MGSRKLQSSRRRAASSCALVAIACCASACSTHQAVVGAGVATVLGAASPGNEIEQTYYLGVFDPLEQVPPSLYRIRVHGQASAFSKTRFASGWVPAMLADALDSDFHFDDATGFLTTARPSASQAIADRKRAEVEAAAASARMAERSAKADGIRKAIAARVGSLKSTFPGSLDEAVTFDAVAGFLADAWKREVDAASPPEPEATRKDVATQAALRTREHGRLSDLRSCAQSADAALISDGATDAALLVKRFVVDRTKAIQAATLPTPAVDAAGALLPAVADAVALVFQEISTLERLAARVVGTSSDPGEQTRTEVAALRGKYGDKVTAASPTAKLPAAEADAVVVPRLLTALGERLDALQSSLGNLCQLNSDLATAREAANTANADDAKALAEFEAKAEASKAIADELKQPEKEFLVGRRMVLFGPEGFRESPRDHRLVIVMGANPQKYFEALGGVLRTVQKVELAEADSAVSSAVEAFSRQLEEEARLAAGHRTTVAQ